MTNDQVMGEKNKGPETTKSMPGYIHDNKEFDMVKHVKHTD